MSKSKGPENVKAEQLKLMKAGKWDQANSLDPSRMHPTGSGLPSTDSPNGGRR